MANSIEFDGIPPGLVVKTADLTIRER